MRAAADRELAVRVRAQLGEADPGRPRSSQATSLRGVMIALTGRSRER